MTEAQRTGPRLWTGSVFEAPRSFWWGIYFFIWTLQVALYAYSLYYSRQGTPAAIPGGEALAIAAFDWYVWALICLFCFWMAARLPLERYSLRWLIPTLALTAAVVVLGRGLLDHVLFSVGGRESLPLADRLILTLPGRYLMVLLFIGLGYGIGFIRRDRERELNAHELREKLATAQLQMLKVQLQPHFLFNTLNAISSLMYRDVAAADRMLVRLSELLRRTLQTMDAQQVTLAEEISFLELYLDILKARFGHRLNSEIRIAEGTYGATVPHLILQPLVENAIKHGISPQLGGGTLLIESLTRDGKLILSVEDDGAGLPSTGILPSNGVGLRNTRERLRHLYGDRCRFDLLPVPAGGVRAEVEIPLEFARVEPLHDTSLLDGSRSAVGERAAPTLAGTPARLSSEPSPTVRKPEA